MDTLTDIQEKIVYLLQGLKINDEETFKIKQCIDAEDFVTAIMLLRRNRVEILDKLHANQQALDDLDLLVYQIKKLEK